jgi:hypothetical protein
MADKPLKQMTDAELQERHRLGRGARGGDGWGRPAVEALRLRDRASRQIRVGWLSTGDGRQFACVGSQLVHGAPVWLIEPEGHTE